MMLQVNGTDGSVSAACLTTELHAWCGGTIYIGEGNPYAAMSYPCGCTCHAA